MTICEINKRLREIKKYANRGDRESAHIEEDRLHEDVLKAISNGSPNPAALAKAALRSKKLDFERWHS